MSALKTIDAETLIAQPLKPIPFIVDGLIPPGLHILAGSPKIGKSWLMLWLSINVAQGNPIWDREVTPCGVLYLCLEDTHNRIQNRLFEITDTAPDNLHFAVMAEQIGSGLQQQIEAFVKTQPDCRLVIIDTLQRVRGADISTNAYANDYRDICELKQLADKHQLAIILVHHLRKHTDKDPFMKVSGTTGLTGGVDTTYVLEKTSARTIPLSCM
jgi:RecA-family ATPase